MCTGQSFRCETMSGKVLILQGINAVRQIAYHDNYKSVSPIPCGWCLECKLKKAEEWVFRCTTEVKENEHNLMLTLTYDNEHLPLTDFVDPETGELTSTLVHQHVQQFINTLQHHLKRNNKKSDFRYFMCGEYGSDKEYIDWKGNVRVGTERPHYHIIFMGLEIDDLKFFKYSHCEWSKDKNALYTSKTLDRLWGRGSVECNEVNAKTINYVARYTTKKLKGQLGKEAYEERGRKPPYLQMSRSPGIGYDYFQKNKERFWNEEPLYIKTNKGILKDVSPLRYYDKLLKKDDPIRFEDIEFKRIQRMQEHMRELLSMTDIDEQQYIENKHRRKEAYAKKMKRVL